MIRGSRQQTWMEDQKWIFKMDFKSDLIKEVI